MSREIEGFATERIVTREVRTPERLHDLLTKTSRTFALNIPLLPEPTRCEVTVAYLLFRVADTLEDATLWSRTRKLDELGRFAELLQHPDAQAAARLSARWTAEPPIDHEGYRELLAELGSVLQTTGELTPESQELIRRHTLRTVEGMSRFLARDEGSELRLRDVRDLQAYCYAVAGIVGEMLTELFLKDRAQLRPVAEPLRDLAPTFGEALQLVNILKDAAWDSEEGRHFLPGDHDPDEVFALARQDLKQASLYVACLDRSGAPHGFVAFTALPLLLAWATIDRVEACGAGAKITREEVGQLVWELNQALDAGTVPALLTRF